VITELVLNHTSDTPWFQRAARASSSTERDFYVWTDNPNRYKDAGHFQDFEPSN